MALISLLYEQAVNSVKQAREKLRLQDIPARSAAISKASDCLGLLIDSLNLDAGGEIGRNLLGLYGYMQNRLLDANLHQSDASLAEVQALLTELHGAWAQLADLELAAQQQLVPQAVQY